MSIALQQSKLGGNGSGTSSATTSAVGYASNTLNGSLLVLVAWANGSVGSGVPGTISINTPVTSGFTWALGKSATAWTDSGDLSKGIVGVWYIANAAVMASTTTTTVNATKSGTSPSVAVEFSLYEFTGVATSSPLETSSTASDSTGGSTDPAPGSLTTANTDLIISAYQCEAASNLAANTGAGFTLGVNATHATTGQTQYILNEAAGTIVTSWPAGQAFWASAAVAFESATQPTTTCQAFLFGF